MAVTHALLGTKKRGERKALGFPFPVPSTCVRLCACLSVLKGESRLAPAFPLQSRSRAVFLLETLATHVAVRKRKRFVPFDDYYFALAPVTNVYCAERLSHTFPFLGGSFLPPG